MSTIRFEKVTALPTTYTANTVYIVKPLNQDLLEIYLSSNTGLTVSRVMDLSDIIALKNTANGLAGLDSNGHLSPTLISELDGQNTLLKVANDYVWDDYINPFVVKSTSGANNPTFGPVIGNMQGLLWPKDTMTQVWCDFHIRHDYALNTKIYPHIHWMPYTAKTGVVRWGVEYVIAKGHQQGFFSATSTTIYIQQTVTAGMQGMHMVAECSDADAILSDQIEPDSVIKMRIFRDAANVADTLQDPIHAWQADLHYQRARLGTMHRHPNFYA